MIGANLSFFCSIFPIACNLHGYFFSRIQGRNDCLDCLKGKMQWEEKRQFFFYVSSRTFYQDTNFLVIFDSRYKFRRIDFNWVLLFVTNEYALNAWICPKCQKNISINFISLNEFSINKLAKFKPGNSFSKLCSKKKKLEVEISVRMEIWKAAFVPLF